MKCLDVSSIVDSPVVWAASGPVNNWSYKGDELTSMHFTVINPHLGLLGPSKCWTSIKNWNYNHGTCKWGCGLLCSIIGLIWHELTTMAFAVDGLFKSSLFMKWITMQYSARTTKVQPKHIFCHMSATITYDTFGAILYRVIPCDITVSMIVTDIPTLAGVCKSNITMRIHRSKQMLVLGWLIRSYLVGWYEKR